MEPIPSPIWIAAAAHHLQLHWHTVDPRELEATARELHHKPELYALPPAEAVAHWLRPIDADKPPSDNAKDGWGRFGTAGPVPF